MRFLLLNQCFYPDVMATAQQLTSLAVGLRERGHEVTVITSDRGYDDPSRRFPRRETWHGIEIIRIPSLAFGKTARWRRVLNFFSFLVACAFRLLLTSRFDCVVALTSPPLISLLGALFVQLKGGKFFFWVMDLNPDEAVAAGWLRSGSLTTRILESFLRYSLRHADRVIALDRFMKLRLENKGVRSEKIEVVSPWSLDDAVAYDSVGREAFRSRYGLQDKFVVMYSGNHSPCHPLDTVVEAAAELNSRDDFAFCFVGGGSEQAKVAAYAKSKNLKNVLCLPYQPLEELSASLSAADLHVAVMGEPFVGIIHPCKVYNILGVGKPLLYIGPTESSIADVAAEIVANGLASDHAVYHAQHGDVRTVVDSIQTAANRGPSERPQTNRELINRFSKATLLPHMINVLEAKEQGGELRKVVGAEC